MLKVTCEYTYPDFLCSLEGKIYDVVHFRIEAA